MRFDEEADHGQINGGPEPKEPFAVSTIPVRHNLETVDRLTWLLNVYHEHWGEPVFGLTVRGDRWLETQQQPFERRAKLDGNWRPLDSFWGGMLENPGLVVIENRSNQRLQVNPSPEQRAVTDRIVVEVSAGDSPPFALVKPGGFPAAFVPIPGVAYQIRAVEGTAQINITAIPG